jgi:hypothetical protein
MTLQQLRDQSAEFVRYGDALTAFVILQALGFAVKLGDGGEFRKRVQDGAWFIPVIIVASGFLYSALVWYCWKANSEITGAIDGADAPSPAATTDNSVGGKAAPDVVGPPLAANIAGRWQHRAWSARIVIIWIATASAFVALLLNRH